MNNSGPIQPPFFNTVPNVTPPQGQQPPSPFHPNVPPPNFSLPPPAIHPGSNFPRFSGPMYNQPTFNPMARACNGSLPPPPPIPVGNMPPPTPAYNMVNNNNNNNNNNYNRGGMNQGPNFNSPFTGQWSNGRNNNSNNNNHSKNSNNTNMNQSNHHPNQQRQMPHISDDIFNDAPKEVPSGFPHLKPTMPPPLPQNAMNLSQANPMPMLHQRGGMGHRGGGNRRGFHHGNNGFHNNNYNNNNNNNNHNNASNKSHNNYNNNRGSGGFRGGMHNRGGFNNNNKWKGGNNNNGHHAGAQNKKEPNVNKGDKPENNAFYCDTCDRGFKNAEKYKEHVDLHQKCSYKDCPFVAVPKVVQLHMNMQHRSGLASKIYSVKSEEDIKKWKEERRKNYPTAENMKKRKEKMDEKIARGEVIETKEFGKMKGKTRRMDHKKDRSRRGRDRGSRFRRDSDFNQSKDEVFTVDDDGDDDDGPPEERKIERSSKEKEKDEVDLTEETNSSGHENPSLKSKEDKIVDLTNSPAKEKSKKDDNCLSLLSGYGSTSSIDSDGNSDEGGNEKAGKETKDKKVKDTIFDDGERGNTLGLNNNTDNVTVGKADVGKVVSDPGSATSPKEKLASDDSNKTKTCPATTQVKEGSESGRSEVSSIQETKGVKRGHATKGGPPNKRQKAGPKPPPKSYTLLEKLLANEIRRERNKILQCVHFIVKNKFFDSNASN